MFYKIIQQARDLWYSSRECTIQSLIAYMERKNSLRDAQIDAIKTYLYLKIAGACKPLVSLFMDGTFNTLSLENEALTATAREYLNSTPAAAALYQYAAQKDENSNYTAKNLLDRIQQNPQSINYQKFFSDVFYNVSYSDYLFSLPMGAGKTYLMAAFIYLDLYFAYNEPDNPAFAHNFMLFAPSGLKSSVIPSLRTIQNFDPSWVLPEPAASEIKRLIQFEILDENKSANKSNRVKNELTSFCVGALTWQGCDFLDKIRDNGIWHKTKEAITKKGIPLMIDTIKTVANAFITAAAEGVANSILKNGGV